MLMPTGVSGTECGGRCCRRCCLSQSRAGIVTGFVLLAGALFLGLSNRRMTLLTPCLAIVIYGAMLVVPKVATSATEIMTDILSLASTYYFNEHWVALVDWLGGITTSLKEFDDVGASLTGTSTASSSTQRALSITEGLRIRAESPLFGTGLGAFIRQGLGHDGAPLVIHSTPVWLLAELGIVGTATFAGLFLYILYPVLKRRPRSTRPADRLLLFLMAAFALFGLTHDIFYQRVFWLLLGMLCARPAVAVGRNRARS